MHLKVNNYKWQGKLVQYFINLRNNYLCNIL